LFEWLHHVCWAAYPERPTVEHMGIDHRCAHVAVAEQLLNGKDDGTSLQQMSGNRMTTVMRAYLFGDSRAGRGSIAAAGAVAAGAAAGAEAATATTTTGETKASAGASSHSSPS
jgi:hypothetical protein